MTTDDTIDRTLRSIDMIINGEVAEPVLKLKQAQRVEWDTASAGVRARLLAAGLGIAALCVAIDLSYTGRPAVSGSSMVQAIPAPQRRPQATTTSAMPAIKAYGASFARQTRRSPMHAAAPRAPLKTSPAAKPAQPVGKQPLSGEALRAALIDDALRTRERNREELRNMQRQ